ncbi:MAG TPA: diguanylate cyclase, partial [Anaeromyxobacteraceae bacterium]|nr:diguanylate cyclase [Anaeromyxobacteraceae bacterium]
MAGPWDEFEQAPADPARPPADPWEEFDRAPAAPAALQGTLRREPVSEPDAAEPDPTTRLRAAHQVTQSINPDQHAKVLEFSRRTGVPESLAATAKRLEFPLDAPENMAAHLTRYASEPRNMALVRDDLGKLSEAEWFLVSPGQSTRKGFASIRASLASSLHRLGLGNLYETPEWRPIETIRGIFKGESDEETARRVEFADAMRQAQDLHAKSILARAWTTPFEAAPYLAAGAVGGTPALVGLGAATTFGPAGERLEALEGPEGQKLTPGQVTAGAAATAVGAGVLFGVGVGPIAKGLVGPVAKRLPGALVDRILTNQAGAAIASRAVARWGAHNALGAAAMAATTALEETTVQLAEKALDPAHEFDVDEVADRTWESFEHAFVGFLGVSAIGPLRQAFHERGISELSRQHTRQLQAAAEALRESKLPDRSPEAAEEFLRGVAPGAQVFVDRAAWDTYWQGKRIDPAKQAADLGAGASYEGSVGGFVALPMDRYLARLGRTEHVLALKDDSKLSAEARTPREEADFQRQQAKLEEEAKKARGPEFEREKALVAEIVRAKAEGAGVEPDQAVAVGATVAETAGSWSLRTGIPVPEVAHLIGVQRLRILGPKGAAVIRDVQTELRKSLSPAAVAELDAAMAGDRRAQSRLEARAYVEPLTGLLNREGFEDYRRNRSPTSWDVAIDANDLGAQDLFGGHAVGDKFLKTIAEAMRAARDATGGEGRLYRWGGDEFHAGGFKTRAQAEAFARALQARLGEAPELAPGYRASVSMGVGVGPEAADAVAYQAKEAKKAKFGAFSKTEPEKFRGTGGESFIAVREEAGPTPEGTRIASIGETPVVATIPAGKREVVPLRNRPPWLTREVYEEKPAVWEWTLAAIEGTFGKERAAEPGEVPEMVHRIVSDYMDRALADFPVNEFGIQQAYSVARLFASTRGGKTNQQWRERFAEWYAKPPEERAKEDPVPERAWGKLIDMMRTETKYVSLASGRFYPKRVDKYRAWYEKTAKEIEAAKPGRETQLEQAERSVPSRATSEDAQQIRDALRAAHPAVDFWVGRGPGGALVL